MSVAADIEKLREKSYRDTCAIITHSNAATEEDFDQMMQAVLTHPDPDISTDQKCEQETPCIMRPVGKHTSIINILGRIFTRTHYR